MANVIDILVSKQAQAELDKVIASLKLTHEEIIKINQQGLKINSGSSAKNPIDLNATIKQNEELNKKYAEQEEKLKLLNAQKQKAQVRTSEEIVNQRALAQASDRQARATSALVGAYANLNAKHQQAKKTLQDLIASQTASSAQIRQAQKEYDLLDKRVVKANNAVRQFNYNVGNYPKQAISGIRNLVGAFGIVGGVSMFAMIAKDIFQTTKELQSLDNALKQVSGTQEQFSRSQAFLREISEDFGIEINGLTTQFTQFYVSAKDKLSGNEIENIFRSISKAGATMGLSVDAQNRAFTALNQMMSKGTIQAEELRGQLGEALPGAFGIMAKAMNTNEVGLAKLMKDGKLLANEVLPKFAEQLEKVYGIENINRVDTLAAAQNRLSNEWTEFIRSLNEGSGVISGFFKTIITEISETIKWWRKLNEETGNFKENFEKKTEQGFQQQLKALQNEADKTGVSLRNLAKVRQDLAVQERAEVKEQIKLREERVKTLMAENPNAIVRGLSGMQDVIDSEKEKIKELAKEYGYWNGVVKATNYILKNNKTTIDEVTTATTGNTEATTKNTEATTKNTKAKKEEEKFILGSIGWFKQKIKLLEAEAEIIKKNSTLVLSENEEYQKQLKTIENYNKGLERLLGLKKELNVDGVSLDLGGSEFITDEDGDELMRQGNELRAWYKEFRESFQDDFWANSGFDKINFIIENFDNLKQSGTDMALALSEAFQQAFNTISEFSNANYQQMYSNLERQRDVSILFAGESTTAREEIDRQYEERRKRIQRQQAESQKRLAMFNIAINTAQGITSALAMLPPNVPLAVTIGIIGAAQLAMTASQPIPQFYKGTQNAPEGLAWTDEKGAELHTDKNGKIKDLGSSKGARLKKLEKGDKIYTASQTKKMMDLYGFNQDFNNIMLTNGISTSNFNNNSVNLEPLNARIDRLTSVVANKSEVTIVNNESGTRYYERVNGQRRELVNSVLTMKSRTIK
jgi:tape measure domain-containing protein